MNRYNEHRRVDQYGHGIASAQPPPPPLPPPPNTSGGHPRTNYVSLHSGGEDDTHYREVQ